MPRGCRRSAVACLLALAAGCGEKRCGLEAVVTLDDQPMDAGYIQFMPVPPTRGQTHGGDVVGGRFVVPAAAGLMPGTYRVEITKSGKSGKTMPDPLGGGKVFDVYENVIPTRFNTESELRAEVKPGVPNRVEFAVASK